MGATGSIYRQTRLTNGTFYHHPVQAISTARAPDQWVVEIVNKNTGKNEWKPVCAEIEDVLNRMTVPGVEHKVKGHGKHTYKVERLSATKGRKTNVHSRKQRMLYVRGYETPKQAAGRPTASKSSTQPQRTAIGSMALPPQPTRASTMQ